MKYAFVKYALVIICCSCMALAQEKKPEPQHHAYKVDVTLTESENGKTINNRSYTMLVNDGQVGNIRQGNRIPINSSGISLKDQSPITQIQYIDIGLNLDCRLVQTNEGLLLRTALDMSSLAPEQAQS